ncbi:hypothetical protein [Kosakonia sp. SMBL-WEM22]|nr:hypothetical protein [Kosakonia sp. SMBL-WEM22]
MSHETGVLSRRLRPQAVEAPRQTVSPWLSTRTGGPARRGDILLL